MTLWVQLVHRFPAKGTGRVSPPPDGSPQGSVTCDMQGLGLASGRRWGRPLSTNIRACRTGLSPVALRAPEDCLMLLSRRSALAATAAAVATPLGLARAAEPLVRIGVLTDLSGQYRDNSGPTTVLAATRL